MRLTLTHPNVLGLSVTNKIIPTLGWLHQDLGMSPDEVVEVISKQPTILNMCLETNLEVQL